MIQFLHNEPWRILKYYRFRSTIVLNMAGEREWVRHYLSPGEE